MPRCHGPAIRQRDGAFCHSDSLVVVPGLGERQCEKPEGWRVFWMESERTPQLPYGFYVTARIEKRHAKADPWHRRERIELSPAARGCDGLVEARDPGRVAGQLRTQQLERDLAAKPDFGGQPHLAHAARSKGLDQVVAVQPRAGGERHWRRRL